MRVSQRLSGLDASFLYLETATQPLHVFSVLELDTSTIPGGYSYDRFRDDLTARVRAIPAFREKLSNSVLNLDHPVWVEDSDFDIDRHVHRLALPAPGGRAEFDEISGIWPVCRSIVVGRCGRCGSSRGLDGSLDGGRLAVISRSTTPRPTV